MPLAALTPVLNDLLKKRGGRSTPTSHHQSIQQLSNSNDSPSGNEYLRKGSIIGQSTNNTNPLLPSSINDVSI
jgi:hypothetical protein